jgi:hypothetical protein
MGDQPCRKEATYTAQPTISVSERAKIFHAFARAANVFGSRIIKSEIWGRGFESHPGTPPQHLHVALTAPGTVHIGKCIE